MSIVSTAAAHDAVTGSLTAMAWAMGRDPALRARLAAQVGAAPGGPVPGTTPEGLVEPMIGRRLEAMFPERPARSGPPLLVVEGLRSKHAGPVGFTLHAGEILGLVGLRGSGRDTVGRLIAGALPARGGRVTLDGQAHDLGRARAAITRGLGFVSSKRVEESLCSGLTLRENLFMLPALAGVRVVGTRAERGRAEGVLAAFGVRPPAPDRVIATLSGGNQQKVVLARRLGVGRSVLILEEPTTGVDVGARAEIYALLARAVAEGLGVLVVSSDFEEVAGLCMRALVFDKGRSVAELEGSKIAAARLPVATILRRPACAILALHSDDPQSLISGRSGRWDRAELPPEPSRAASVIPIPGPLPAGMVAHRSHPGKADVETHFTGRAA